MINFDIECIDTLAHFLISQARYRHTTPEILINEILTEWKSRVEKGEVESPPGLDVNAAARKPTQTPTQTPTHTMCHIHFQNKLHMWRGVLNWILKVNDPNQNPWRESNVVSICALDMHWNPKVKHMDSGTVDTSSLEAGEPAIHCGDCLLLIDNDFLPQWHELCKELDFEWGPESSNEPVPEAYQHLFNKSLKEILDKYPFPEYIKKQGCWSTGTDSSASDDPVSS